MDCEFVMESRKEVKVEIFYDYSSPWTYLAFSQLPELFNRVEKVHGVKVSALYKPILVGGIFNKVNPSVYEARKSMIAVPLKAAYSVKDLQEWSDAYNLKIRGPYDPDPSKRVSPFPVNSIKSLRGALWYLKKAQDEGSSDPFLQYSFAIFKAYWSDSKDISQDEVLREVVESLGHDSFDDFRAFIEKSEVKQKVRKYTEDCMDRGGFGS